MPISPDDRDEFERLSKEDQPSLAAEVLDFLKHNKKWWLVPILLIMGVAGALAALASSGAAPFIYTMF